MLRAGGQNEGTQRRHAGAAAVAMTRGNQHELACQKNMKKQSDSVKGKRRDDGLSAAARKQRDLEIMQQKQKNANEKKEEPKQLCGFVSNPLALRLCAWSQSHHTRVFSCSAHRAQHRWHSLCLESAAGPFCASFPSGSLSPPGPRLGGEGVTTSQCFLFLWGSPPKY
ncbi:uncharacterized protein LOC119873569 isoform X3 [Canis lupus familiaris]|nr:uncharacterized protein LOC119873569 isoform X3 [Canis lupus familiaris]